MNRFTTRANLPYLIGKDRQQVVCRDVLAGQEESELSNDVVKRPVMKDDQEGKASGFERESAPV